MDLGKFQVSTVAFKIKCKNGTLTAFFDQDFKKKKKKIDFDIRLKCNKIKVSTDI